MKIPDLNHLLSPILVKEFRQGVRSKVFAGSFILLQILLLIAVSLGFFTKAMGQGASSGFFWTIICLPLIVIMPGMGINSLKSEIDGNTLELIFISKLSAYRIITGKWMAIVAQTLLMAISIMPFIVLRYFIGGINFWDELLFFLGVIVTSAIMTSFTVSISAFPMYPILKWALFLVGGYMVMALAMFMSVGGMFLPSVLPSVPVSSYVSSVIFFIFAVLLMFEVGTLQIAPLAENRTTKIRLILVLIFSICAWGVYSQTRGDEALYLIVAWGILTPCSIGFMAESVKRIPNVYSPFLKIKYIGKTLGVFLYPGWVSGVYFSLASFALVLFITANSDSSSGSSNGPFANPIWICSLLVGLFFPLGILKFLFRRVKKFFTYYLLIQMILFFPLFLYGIFERTTLLFGEFLRTILPFFPTSFFFYYTSHFKKELNALDIAGLALTVGLTLFLISMSMIREWKVIFEMEREARLDLKKSHS